MTTFKCMMEEAQALVTLTENCVVTVNLVKSSQVEIHYFFIGDPTRLLPLKDLRFLPP